MICVLLFWNQYTSVMSTIQCRGTEIGETDTKNDATAQERGTFPRHERKKQNGF